MTRLGTRSWPALPEEWKQVFRARREAAKHDAPSAFFFELDWNVAPDMAAVARTERLQPVLATEEWITVRETLDRRLALRRAGGSFTRAVPRPIVERLSGMIHAAAAKLPAEEWPVARVLERFGAGRLLRRAAFGTPDDPGVFEFNDADSYFVWMFAEFGLHSIELDVDVDRWRPLLRSLLLAGWFYSHRFRADRAPKPEPLQWYLRPGAPLSDDDMRACAAAFDGIWNDVGDDATPLERRADVVFSACLRRVSSC